MLDFLFRSRFFSISHSLFPFWVGETGKSQQNPDQVGAKLPVVKLELKWTWSRKRHGTDYMNYEVAYQDNHSTVIKE